MIFIPDRFRKADSTIILKSIFIGLISFLFSCDKEPDISLQVNLTDYCPTCSDEVSWNRYGRWELEEYSFLSDNDKNGDYEEDIPVNLETTCNWESEFIYVGIFNSGDGYQEFYSDECNKGVIFRWESGDLTSFILTDGWIGSTEEGIKIGEELGIFLDTYPEFQESSSDSLQYYCYCEGKEITADFTTDKKLERLVISRN